MQAVISAAILCGVVLGFVKNGPGRQLMKLICGVMLTLAVLKSMARVDVGNFEVLPQEKLGQQTAQIGEEMARQAQARLIKEQTEAYILGKAEDLDLDLRVEVEMGAWDPPVPIAVTLEGEAPPYLRQLLSQIIRQELGIEKEDQKWTS